MLLIFIYCWDLLQHYFPSNILMKMSNHGETQKELYSASLDSTVTVLLYLQHFFFFATVKSQ